MNNMTPIEILDRIYLKAFSNLSKSAVKFEITSKKVEFVCRCNSNKAPIRFLLSCLLAKTHNPQVDIRKPYTEIEGRDTYSGRFYDERFKDAYMLDIFRVIGGSDHAKFMHGYFGDISTAGLKLKPIADYGFDTQMQNFRGDTSPDAGWSVTWHLKDFYNYLPPNTAVHLRYTDLTRNASAAIAETWVAFGFSDSQVEWLPSLMVRNQGENDTLATTFLGIIEPFGEASNIKSVKRLDLFTRDQIKYSDMNTAVKITFIDGRQDLILAMDSENPLKTQPSFLVEKEVRLPDLNLRTDAEFCLFRMNASNKIERIALAKGSFLNVGSSVVELSEKTDFIEIEIGPGEYKIVTGKEYLVKKVVVN